MPESSGTGPSYEEANMKHDIETAEKAGLMMGGEYGTMTANAAPQQLIPRPSSRATSVTPRSQSAAPSGIWGDLINQSKSMQRTPRTTASKSHMSGSDEDKEHATERRGSTQDERFRSLENYI